MTEPVVTAELWIDGVRFADGSTGEGDDAPVALSGLSVVWGRATTIDQVEPSTCSFDVLDPAGGDAFLGALYVGADIDVHARGVTSAPSTLPINEDPSYESAPVGTDPFGHYQFHGSAVVVDDRAATGAQSVRLDLDNPYTPGSSGMLSGSWVPPAPYDELDPSAWDDLPKYKQGEQWSASAALWPPIGGGVEVYLYGFPSARVPAAGNAPYSAGAGAASVGAIPGAPVGWQTATIKPQTVAAGVVGMWPGLLLRMQVCAWQNIPVVTAGVGNQIAWEDTAGSWADWGTSWVDDVRLLPPDTASMVHRDVVVFSGRITDLDAGYDTAADAVVCSVVAEDFTAGLGNRDVGAEPWPAETVSARFARIVAAAGVAVPYTIAPTLAGYVVSYLDVDRQQVWPLLADIATSVDGVLWSATHLSTGPYLWLSDPRVQAALYVLVDEGGVVVIRPTGSSELAIPVDACDVDLDPVVFRQAAADITTRVALTWREQTLNDEGLPAPTDRTLTLIDPVLEAERGTRRLAVSTLLTTPDDAGEVAALLAGRLHSSSWRVAGLVWRVEDQTPPDKVAASLDLLDGTRRVGVPLILSNLPEWAPTGGTVPLLLQGGTYDYVDGRWILTLTTSSAGAQGAAIPWEDVDPAWNWNEFDPAIAWTDLVGVAAV